MTVIFPENAKEVVDRQKSDVKSELEFSNPWLNNSFISDIPTGLGNRVFDYYFQLEQSIKERFPNTATGEYLQMWADLKNMIPISAAPASGFLTMTGVVGSPIATGEVYKIDSLEYTVDADVSILANVLTVSLLNATGTVATCITDDDHGLATGLSVTIAGANEAAWNDVWTDITVTGDKSFTFTVPLGIVSPATGTITCSFDGVTASVTCSANGDGTNQDGGVQLTAEGSVAGVDDIATVQFNGLQGGNDEETTEAYQERIVERWRNPQTPFNPATIEATIKAISGNTRVWVHRVTPVIGAVTAYFVRDGDADIIPSTSEEDTAKAAIEEIIPGNTDPVEVYIVGPEAVPIDISITNIVPDSLTMRQAVSNTISAFYRGGIAEGEDHEVDKLKSAIFQTYDVTQQRAISSFVLNSPTSDTAIAQGQLATEGTVDIDN